MLLYVCIPDFRQCESPLLELHRPSLTQLIRHVQASPFSFSSSPCFSPSQATSPFFCLHRFAFHLRERHRLFLCIHLLALFLHRVFTSWLFLLLLLSFAGRGLRKSVQSLVSFLRLDYWCWFWHLLLTRHWSFRRRWSFIAARAFIWDPDLCARDLYLCLVLTSRSSWQVNAFAFTSIEAFSTTCKMVTHVFAVVATIWAYFATTHVLTSHNEGSMHWIRSREQDETYGVVIIRWLSCWCWR